MADISVVALAGEKEFIFNNTRLTAKEWGVRGAYPIIALHGWLDNCGTFDVLAPLLENVHIVALDSAGHGLSSHRQDHGPYNMWQDVFDLHQVVEQLGWQQFSLLGHSRGAMISTLFAGTFPERVSQLALIDSVWPMPVEPEETPQQLKKSIIETHSRQKRAARVFPDVATAIQLRQRSEVPISETAAGYLMQRGIKQVQGGYVWSTDPNLLLPSAVKFSFEQIKSFVDAITAKMLLILAKDGLPHVYEKHKEALKQFEQINVVEMDGGHHLHLEDQAQQIADVLNVYFKTDNIQN